MVTQKENSSIALIQNDLSYIKRDISEIKSTVTTGYVTRSEWEPYKKVIQGVVSLILIAVVGSLLSLVLK